MIITLLENNCQSSLRENLNILGKIQKNFFQSSRKDAIEIDKNGNESVATISYNYLVTILLIVQDLWQIHDQVLLII